MRVGLLLKKYKFFFLLPIGEIIREFPRNKRKFSNQDVELNIKETEINFEDKRSKKDVKERYVYYHL